MNCTWPGKDDLMLAYHDNEWGMPLHDDQKLFEFLVLDTFQAGLSWKTILHKRQNFKNAFDNFEAKKISKYDAHNVAELLQNEGIIRNKLKIAATINNAQKFLQVQKEFGSFDTYIWQFTEGKQINNKLKKGELIVTSAQSDAMSKVMKKYGFKFCGSTICYAFMQAAGMYNDHFVSCEKYKNCIEK